MFVDFDKVFNDKPQPQLRVPDAFVGYLNKQLPDGLVYKIDEEGTCVITGGEDSFTLGGFEYVISSEDKKILGKNYTIEDVLKLFYNRQKPIPLRLKKEGFVLLNGDEFPIEKMFLNPHNPIKKESGTFFMLPEKFPKPFKLDVGCDRYERALMISRVPCDSVHGATFESEKDIPLRISYRVDSKDHKLSMDMSFNLSYAKTIRDIVEATSIYNAYLDGKGYLCGKPLETKLHGKNVKRFDDSSITFWEKVLEIEKHLAVSFTPPREDVDFSTMCLVEQLYQNLINNTPIRETIKPESLDGVWDSIDEEDVVASIGSRIYFEFEATRTVELFGVKFNLYGLIGILDAVLADFSKKGKNHKIVLKDVSEESPCYASSIFFKNEDMMKMYKAGDHNLRISQFTSAKRAREYYMEE